MPTINCKTCGKEISATKRQLETGRKKFCSKQCSAKDTFLGKKKKPRTDEHRAKLSNAAKGKYIKRVTVQCHTCGENYSVQPYLKDKRKFCSRKCLHAFMRTRTGRSNPLYKRQQMNCEWCGKSVDVKRAKIHEFKYCSRQCLGAATAHKMANKNGPTSIEREMSSALSARNIQHETNYRIAVWLIDIVIPEHRIAIECDGVYWHNLPGQKIKDMNKNNWLIAHKWRIVRFWESEIKENVNDCANYIQSLLNLR